MSNTRFSPRGHEILNKHCYNEYIPEDNESYKGYEYRWSGCLLYVFDGKEPVFSKEFSCEKWTRDNWAKYFINEFINKH